MVELITAGYDGDVLMSTEVRNSPDEASERIHIGAWRQY